MGNRTSISTTVLVDTTAPTTPSLSFSGLSSNTYYKSSTNALYFNPSPGGAFTLTASSSDPNTGIAGYTFSSLSSLASPALQNGGRWPTRQRLGHTAAQRPDGVRGQQRGRHLVRRQLRTDRRRHAAEWCAEHQRGGRDRRGLHQLQHLRQLHDRDPH